MARLPETQAHPHQEHGLVPTKHQITLQPPRLVLLKTSASENQAKLDEQINA